MRATANNSHPAETRRDATVGEPPIPALDFDITSEIEQLYHTEAWQTGISVKQLVRFSDPQIKPTAMKVDARIELQQNPVSMAIFGCMPETALPINPYLRIK